MQESNLSPFLPPLFIMNYQALQIYNEKLTSNKTQIRVLLLAFTLLLLTLIQIHFNDGSSGSLLSRPPEIKSDGFRGGKPEKECDIFSGKWVENPKGSYYNNRTCDFQIYDVSCRKYGRKDEEFLKWRWKPDECELPFFDGVEFLDVVRGKSLAFVGDSLAKNQMQSLVCLLSTVASPEEISKNYTSNNDIRSFFYPHYNVTISTFWSPYLVKTQYLDPTATPYNIFANLYLDEPDEAWSTEIESFDYVIISAGVWFFRPLKLYENDQIVGCNSCDETNITKLGPYYGYRRAFRTAFSSLNMLENFKGVTFLRTVSPSHYENGEWNNGGSCGRKLPLTREEMKVQWYTVQMVQTQMEEFGVGKKKGLERGLEFRVLNVTEAMAMRPDGHPSHYFVRKEDEEMVDDCTHWCLPGPIDTWNELLFYTLMNSI